MMFSPIFFIVIAIAVPTSYCDQEEYRWQNYDGVVPADAIEAGVDKNGDTVYIAQAAVQHEGHLPTSLYPKVAHVNVPINQLSKVVTSGIKILCGSQQPVTWLRTNGSILQVDLIGKNPVRGGDFFNSNIHVGRIYYDDGIHVGPILSYNLDHAQLAITHEDRVWFTHTYEVLVYGTGREQRHRPGRRGPNRGRNH